MMTTHNNFDAAAVNAAAHHLECFAAANADVRLTVLTTNDGFEVASFPAKSAAAARIAAMSSSMQALSKAMAQEAGLQESRSLIVETETGTVLVLGLTGTSPGASLAVVASSNELLGKILWATRNLCKTLENSLRR